MHIFGSSVSKIKGRQCFSCLTEILHSVLSVFSTNSRLVAGTEQRVMRVHKVNFVLVAHLMCGIKNSKFIYSLSEVTHCKLVPVPQDVD